MLFLLGKSAPTRTPVNRTCIGARGGSLTLENIGECVQSHWREHIRIILFGTAFIKLFIESRRRWSTGEREPNEHFRTECCSLPLAALVTPIEIERHFGSLYFYGHTQDLIYMLLGPGSHQSEYRVHYCSFAGLPTPWCNRGF